LVYSFFEQHILIWIPYLFLNFFKKRHHVNTTYHVTYPIILRTGSIFELSGGAPKIGFGPSAALIALGGPLCIFLFIAAVQKGAAETEEDDANFKAGR
jgi:hypothetical protein